MRLFKGSVKTDTGPLPGGQTLPRATVHHHHKGPSPVGVVLAAAIGVMAVIALVWYGGIFLVRQFGARNPEQTWATILASLPVVLFLLYSWNTHAGRREKEKRDHEREMKLLEIEVLRLQQARQPSFLNGSRVGNDIRLAELIMMIMKRAYEHYENHGPFQGQERPWSRRKAEDMVLVGLGETTPVKERLANQAKNFLLEYEVILHNQINIRRYPDLNAVRRLLSRPVTPLLLAGDNTLPADVGGLLRPGDEG